MIFVTDMDMQTNMDMQTFEKIQAELDKIERAHNVRIIYCAESGSRAWGIASPDSDYDVRFVYVHDEAHYLRLDPSRDVIEWMLDDVLDISGWDLKKTLTLLHGSNPALYEWSVSPIVYRTSEDWGKVADIMKGCFSPKSVGYHYLSLARKTYKIYCEGERVRLKKYFYVLRPILACRWALDFGTAPPIAFCDLRDKYLDGAELEIVNELLAQKTMVAECGDISPVKPLHAYIEAQIEQLEKRLNSLPPRRHNDWEPLNAAFASIVGHTPRT